MALYGARLRECINNQHGLKRAREDKDLVVWRYGMHNCEELAVSATHDEMMVHTQPTNKYHHDIARRNAMSKGNRN